MEWDFLNEINQCILWGYGLGCGFATVRYIQKDSGAMNAIVLR